MRICTIILLLAIIQFSYGQISNERDLIVQNKVKSSLEKHCFLNSNSSCTIIYEEYDRNGNPIEWDMGRIGSYYQNVYDKEDNKIMTLWIDKTDTTEIDTAQYAYDHNNQLIREIFSEDTTEYINHYDEKGQLIKTISSSMNSEGNIVQVTITTNWTSFGKIKNEITKTEIFEVTSETKYNKIRKSEIEYEFDQNQNIIKTTYYNQDTISRTITYKYDIQNRVIEKLDYDPVRIERTNKIGFGNRKNIEIFKTSYTYLDNGQVDELYTYFFDPCMSLDNHFLYKNYYQSNGLLDHADVYENNKIIFTISYEYEFFE